MRLCLYAHNAYFPCAHGQIHPQQFAFLCQVPFFVCVPPLQHTSLHCTHYLNIIPAHSAMPSSQVPHGGSPSQLHLACAPPQWGNGDNVRFARFNWGLRQVLGQHRLTSRMHSFTLHVQPSPFPTLAFATLKGTWAKSIPGCCILTHSPPLPAPWTRTHSRRALIPDTHPPSTHAGGAGSPCPPSRR